MDSWVFVAVLFAALCHAGWNAAVKRGLDPLATTILMSIGAALVGLAMLAFTGLPANAAWPWVIASVLIHHRLFRGADRKLRRRRYGSRLSAWRAARRR